MRVTRYPTDFKRPIHHFPPPGREAKQEKSWLKTGESSGFIFEDIQDTIQMNHAEDHLDPFAGGKKSTSAASALGGGEGFMILAEPLRPQSNSLR